MAKRRHQLPKPFGIDLTKHTLTRGQVIEWAEDQMARGVPRQHVCEVLVGMSRRILGDNEMKFGNDIKTYRILASAAKAMSDAERKLFTPLVDRNTDAIELEKLGRTDEAVELYELNVHDKVRALIPYERLLVIYVRRGDYDNAIRICQEAARNLPDRVKTRQKRCCDPEFLKKLMLAREKSQDGQG